MMLFKYSSIFSSDSHSSNRVCIFEMGQYEQHLCELILNFEQWSRERCRLMIFFLVSSLATILPIFVKPFVLIMENIAVKLFQIGTCGSK